ncbi:tagaturonate reductase [Pedobacter faecalis]|uniref:tagaturonate reductase n=1 Tax=Pedobacter faecalis TaxID=3041495 RepID=UPI00254DF9F5|nr:tagaturonate reductase [Pedobacter sp. ELA7]
MNLSKKTLAVANTDFVAVPSSELLELPEKVLQFGTGVLLRGLPDYFIDKANRKGFFNGRVVVVKSTPKGDAQDFANQDGLYTVCVRGLERGEPVEENLISSAISRVIPADQDWASVLEAGSRQEIKLIVSNTTEVGIQLVKESIDQHPPVSFPAKLLAVLVERYKALGNCAAANLVVVPTELIPDAGAKLKAIVYELIVFNGLDRAFKLWLDRRVYFCSSLVDRIVPGKPDAATLARLEGQLGYSDDLLIICEPYRLWAIEGDAQVADLIGLTGVDDGFIVTSDIEIFRELKVRLLNGTHTLSCGLAVLSGIPTVSSGMTDQSLRNFISVVMQSEIVPAIPYAVEPEVAMAFSASVIDRFANPYIEHLWINITFQYTMKMKIRVVPIILEYYRVFNRVPENIALGFAAYLHFVRPREFRDGKYYGTASGHAYVITDDAAAYFFDKRELADQEYVHTVMADEVLWGTDLTKLNGFAGAVEAKFSYISEKGVKAALAGANSV